LQLELAYLQAMKDPENVQPSFRPEINQSQGVVMGREYQTFDKFLKEMDYWRLRKEKKIRDKQNEII
jgi:hypothetical protein